MPDIPRSVVDAVNCLLRPYGINFSDFEKNLENRYVTAKQASFYCGLAPKTIRDRALAGDFGSIRVGKSAKSRVLIRKSELDNWLEGFSSQKKQDMA